jgi:phenylacetyl-CoA:acceptor oxidoreductase subunit 1
MVIDVNRCVGCQTCTIACKHTNDTPPGVQWRRVLDVEQGEFPDVERLFLVVGCQHCAEPPCVPVCPTGATRQRADGLVTMDYDLCIGCGYCAVACPYQARTIVHDQEWYYGRETVQERHVSHDERLGVATKCTFCVDRVDDGLTRGLTPGVDPEATPACASSCITQAIQFGDFNDTTSNVSRMVREGETFQMHRELGTDPQIKYLVDAPATPGREGDAADVSDQRLGDPANALVGKRQEFWDVRAAMNFTMGGFGSGLAIVAYLLYLTRPASGAWPQSMLMLAFFVSGVAIAIGLFFVLLEIGRKLRFLLVMRRPQTSWMTRETYAVAVFYPALAADILWPNEVLHAVVALAAAAFLYSQARILHAGKGIPAWRVPSMPLMLVATGLFEGLGLLLIIDTLIVETATGAAGPAAGVALAAVNGWLWHRYHAGANAAGIPPLARAELARITPWLHGVGHTAPAVLYALALGWPDAPAALLAIAGLATLAGGALWKYTVIVRASYAQGFALPRIPRRGSGSRAAPARYGMA